MNILDKIVERKREEITAAQNKIPEDRLREQAEQRRNAQQRQYEIEVMKHNQIMRSQ